LPGSPGFQAPDFASTCQNRRLKLSTIKRTAVVRARVRQERPDVYLRVVASILPKHLELKNDDNIFDGISADQLDAILAYTCNALGIADEDAAGASETPH
jgi:hypothetical protein